jgi:hypothetical protein
MDRAYRPGVGLAVAAVVLCAHTAMAQSAAQKSLTNCQDAVRKAAEKFLAGEVKAMGACLKKVAANVIKANIAVTNTTATGCVKSFRKLNDSRLLGKSLPEKLAAKIKAKCDPTVALHTTDDITGKNAPGVTEPIQTQRIDLFCQHFGGDGSIDSFSEWTTCVQTAIECQARQAIALEYPRAPEWFDDVKVVMMTLPGNPDDPSMIADAISALSLADFAIDPNADDIPDIRCGGGGIACVTGCCYFENLAPAGPETSCVQYTGTFSSVNTTFALSCSGSSLPGLAGFQFHTFGTGPCTVGPIRGTPCAGVPNRVVIPTDSSCP